MSAVSQPAETVPLLAGFSPDELATLTGAGHRRRLAKGDVLCRKGDVEASLFVIVAGKIAVRQSVRDEDVPLAILRPGETCGEIAIITGCPRTADLVASADSEVVEITAEVLDRLLLDHPDLATKFWQSIARMLAIRLANTNDLVSEYVGINKRIIDDPEFRRFYSRL